MGQLGWADVRARTVVWKELARFALSAEWDEWGVVWERRGKKRQWSRGKQREYKRKILRTSYWTLIPVLTKPVFYQFRHSQPCFNTSYFLII